MTSFPLTWVVLIGLMSAITLGVLLEPKNGEDVFVFGSAHEHASISIKIFNDTFDMVPERFQLQSPFIHLEASNGFVIHRHSEYVTLGYFFDTLNLGLTQDCFTFDRNEFCSNEEYTLKFYINEKQVDDIRDYLIWEGDLILISYGDDNPEEIAQQLADLKAREFPFDLRESFDNYQNV